MSARFLSSSAHKGITLSSRSFTVRANVGSGYEPGTWKSSEDVLYQQGVSSLLNARRSEFQETPNSYVLSCLSNLSKDKVQFQEEVLLSISDSKRSNLGAKYQQLDPLSPCVLLRQHFANYLSLIAKQNRQIDGLGSLKSFPTLSEKEFTKPLDKTIQERLSQSQLSKAESEVAQRLASYREGPAPKARLADPEVQRVAYGILSNEQASGSFISSLKHELETGYVGGASWEQISGLLSLAQSVLKGLIQKHSVKLPSQLTADQLAAKIFPTGDNEWNYTEDWEAQRQELIDQTLSYQLLEELDLQLASHLYPSLVSPVSSLEKNIASRQASSSPSPLQKADLERFNEVSQALVTEEFQTILAILDLPNIKKNVPEWTSLTNTQVLHKLRSWRKWTSMNASSHQEQFNSAFSKETQKQLQDRLSSVPIEKQHTIFEQVCEEKGVSSDCKGLHQYYNHQQNSEILSYMKEHNINLPVAGAPAHLVRRALNLALSKVEQDPATTFKQQLEASISADAFKEFNDWAASRSALASQQCLPSIREFASQESTPSFAEAMRQADMPFVKLAFDAHSVSGLSFSKTKKDGYVRLSDVKSLLPAEEPERHVTRDELMDVAESFRQKLAGKTVDEMIDELEKQVQNRKL